MKPTFELSKNTIIIGLICVIIFIVALVSIPGVIKSENKEKASKKENTDTIATASYVRIFRSHNTITRGYINAINSLQDYNEMLVRENSLLKKKVNYYFEYYRKNQPVGMEVAEDTVPYPYWYEPYKLNPMRFDSSWIHSDSIMFEMDGDTFYFRRGALYIDFPQQ